MNELLLLCAGVRRRARTSGRSLGVAGVLGDYGFAVQLALIWLAHIGADRLLGYGLKYPTAFTDTHLQRV